MSTSSKKTKTNIRKVRDGVSAYKPGLQDFKRRGSSESKSGRIGTDREKAIESQRSLQTRRMDDIFDTFRRDVEDMMMPWSSSSSLWDWRFPSLPTTEDIQDQITVRMPIFDMVEKEDKYEVKVEVPGIEKDKVKVKATEGSVEISGEQSKEEESEDKRKRFVYNERSYNSFYRKIPVPEEIVSSKVRAKMSNGVLHIELPKKNPTKLEEDGTTVEVK
ncbi:MAG TPA: Hsp20/alpha crystallin family protein [Nitrososphaeraceae archaeon]|jgi:HSP20 family protein|nr:Hsp20/alpha crystallin family protein [Nitrososphaeraceae archaeon]